MLGGQSIRPYLLGVKTGSRPLLSRFEARKDASLDGIRQHLGGRNSKEREQLALSFQGNPHFSPSFPWPRTLQNSKKPI